MLQFSRHPLFHLAHACIFVGYLSPNTQYGGLALHCFIALGYAVLTIWAWTSTCAQQVFTWSFSFTVINVIQVFCLLYKIRPVKFACDIEDIYVTMFQPLNVPRSLFKKLISSECCSTINLQPKQMYALEELTRIKSLGLLIKGTATVLRNGNFIHEIGEKEFLDSPEFQANFTNEERFHVSVIAKTPCKYLSWNKHALEYLLSREPHLADAMRHLLARDIVNKIYQLRMTHEIIRDIRC